MAPSDPRRGPHPDDAAAGSRSPGHGEFKNARRLADSEIALIARWVKAGAPEGDARELPPPVEFHSRWRLGEPDLVLTPEAAFSIPARQGDLYRCFVLPDTVGAHRWVSATEVRPGNPKVVHHLVTFLDTTGVSAGLDLAEPGAGYTCFGGPRFESRGSLGSWAVGASPLVLPPGVGMELPAGARVVMLVHYHNHGATPATDRTAIGIHFARSPIGKRVKDFSVHALNFVIPAGARRHEVRASDAVPAGSQWHAIAVVPHMHLLGREIRVTATYPDGTVRPLVYVADWDFNWQDFYYYAAPVPLPGGTRIDLSCIFDNSARNPRNPHAPPREVWPGERTTDEMCVVYFQVTDDADLVDKGTPPPRPRACARAPGARRARVRVWDRAVSPSPYKRRGRGEARLRMSVSVDPGRAPQPRPLPSGERDSLRNFRRGSGSAHGTAAPRPHS